MNKTGTIVSIIKVGGYQSQQGYIYTFNMTIDCDGQHYTGEIGSKSEVYPANPGQQITVTMTQDQYGVKFKKFNPKYAQQDQQQGTQQPQQGTQQPQQGTQQPAGRPIPAPRPANSVNSSIERQCAFKSACTWGIGKTADDVMKLTKRGHDFIQTGEVSFEQFAAENPVESDVIQNDAPW